MILVVGLRAYVCMLPSHDVIDCCLWVVFIQGAEGYDESVDIWSLGITGIEVRIELSYRMSCRNSIRLATKRCDAKVASGRVSVRWAHLHSSQQSCISRLGPASDDDADGCDATDGAGGAAARGPASHASVVSHPQKSGAHAGGTVLARLQRLCGRMPAKGASRAHLTSRTCVMPCCLCHNGTHRHRLSATTRPACRRPSQSYHSRLPSSGHSDPRACDASGWICQDCSIAYVVEHHTRCRRLITSTLQLALSVFSLL